MGGNAWRRCVVSDVNFKGLVHVVSTLDASSYLRSKEHIFPIKRPINGQKRIQLFLPLSVAGRPQWHQLCYRSFHLGESRCHGNQPMAKQTELYRLLLRSLARGSQNPNPLESLLDQTKMTRWRRILTAMLLLSFRWRRF